ncbi:hypothetical protein M2283_001907 [Streptomyces pseudovenezuelae]|uniref:N-acetyltransferase domain-containing protein n=1 Tax=Streptomyces pseudovenezuelae TaxID=67350 RepID=A0ABT6LFQ1_9ACTN|nr:hypothetical protein [Streptomyces pseudovenezuelae]
MPAAEPHLLPGNRRVGAQLHGGGSSTLLAARLRRANRWLALDLAGELADLYMDSRETPLHETSPQEASFREAYPHPSRRRFLNRLASDIRRPGFAMVIAETDGLVGCAFGFPLRSGGAWWPGCDGTLPSSIEQLAEFGSVFAITDILVRSHPRDHEIVARLQARLLTDHQASLGVILVDHADRAALAALRSWGWLDVGEIWRPRSATVLRVLVLSAGGRTAGRLAELVHDARMRWPG